MTRAAVILRRDVNVGARHTGFTGGNTCIMTGRTIIAVNTEVIESNTGKGREIHRVMTR